MTDTPRVSAKGRLRRCGCLLAAALLALLVAVGCLAVRPVWHVWSAWRSDVQARPLLAAGHVDDASRLNETTMTEVLAVVPDRAQAEEQLRKLLARARAEDLRVAVAGARHSMGGHTIYPGGIALDMLPFNHIELDSATTDILHVGAGARWSEILPYLNERGLSVGVMQSNNSFSVGGSISVNCHGWQTGRPPIACTVESLRLMKADGSVVTCSRTENPELFSLVLGGYGLFGIILDVDLRVVPNEMLRLERTAVAVNDYAGERQKRAAQDDNAVLGYGRLDVTADGFLESALLNVWKREAGLDCTTAPMGAISMGGVRRAIFRGSVGDDYGKAIRWWAEQELQPIISSDCATRNELLNVGVELFENRSASDTDILHEYFVPPDRFEEFVKAARETILQHKGDLLNVTVRDVQEDKVTYLRYADQPMLCLVMLFNQERTAAADQRMEAMTQDLIDAALALGARYYLCYRLHGTQEQIRQAYPMLDSFFAKKREHDPGEVFQNEFYRKYAGGGSRS